MTDRPRGLPTRGLFLLTVRHVRRILVSESETDMEAIKVFFAPISGQHKIGDAPAIFVRRPVQYAKGGGSATAIKIEGYMQAGPRRIDHTVSGPVTTDYSEPIHVRLIWVTADHRGTWDAATGGRTGTAKPPAEYVTGADLLTLQRALADAVVAIVLASP